MGHQPETSVQEAVYRWFAGVYGEKNVHTQVYQPGPRWFCDIVVDTGYATLYVEVENDADSVRPGMAQALGYAAADQVRGIPVVVTPKGHLDGERAARLRSSSTVLVREFDVEASGWC